MKRHRNFEKILCKKFLWNGPIWSRLASENTNTPSFFLPSSRSAKNDWNLCRTCPIRHNLVWHFSVRSVVRLSKSFLNHGFDCCLIVVVRVGFCLWAIELVWVMKKTAHFGVGIVWGAIPSVLPVFQISVSGCSWDSHGTRPNLWVQKKLVKFWQGSQDTWLCFAKFLREFLGYSPLDLLGDLGDVILS